MVQPPSQRDFGIVEGGVRVYIWHGLDLSTGNGASKGVGVTSTGPHPIRHLSDTLE